MIFQTNTDIIADALKCKHPAIDTRSSPKPGMTGILFSFFRWVFFLLQTISPFLDFPGILDTEDGYRISQVRAVEIENLIISSGVSISPDSQPVKKSAVWNPYSFFTGSPPIRATLDGHLGCWKASTHQRMAHKGFRKFVFIRDKWPGNLSDKRPASSDIATVSSDNYAATCNLFPKQIVPS